MKMYQKLIFLSLLLFLNFSCSKKEELINVPVKSDKAYEVYSEAVETMNEGNYFYAAKRFSEAEKILPKLEDASKASLMSSYCYYTINFYEEATKGLERFIKVYPANKDIDYAYYLLALVTYEQILDEKKDIAPLLESRKKINFFLNTFPNTDYALDLKYKLDLINNQLAAKEMYISKYYIKTQKWIPAINRLKNIVENYSETVFIEEALHRLVEVYYKIGLEEEAKSTAILLGYNYNSSKWYQNSYKLLNKDYKIPKIKDNKKDKDPKETGLVKRTIKKFLYSFPVRK